MAFKMLERSTYALESYMPGNSDTVFVSRLVTMFSSEMQLTWHLGWQHPQRIESLKQSRACLKLISQHPLSDLKYGKVLTGKTQVVVFTINSDVLQVPSAELLDSILNSGHTLSGCSGRVG